MPPAPFIKSYNRHLRNAKSRINTAFLLLKNKYKRRTFRFLQIFFTRQFCYHIHVFNIAI